jgi:hypothetical protein
MLMRGSKAQYRMHLLSICIVASVSNYLWFYGAVITHRCLVDEETRKLRMIADPKTRSQSSSLKLSTQEEPSGIESRELISFSENERAERQCPIQDDSNDHDSDLEDWPAEGQERVNVSQVLSTVSPLFLPLTISHSLRKATAPNLKAKTP